MAAQSTGGYVQNPAHVQDTIRSALGMTKTASHNRNNVLGRDEFVVAAKSDEEVAAVMRALHRRLGTAAFERIETPLGVMIFFTEGTELKPH